LPAESTAIPVAALSALTPRYVEKISAVAVEFSFVTKVEAQICFQGGPHCPPPNAPWNAFAVGKFDDKVVPATYAFPLLSTAIPVAASKLFPPKYVEYTSELAPERSVFNFDTKPSEHLYETRKDEVGTKVRLTIGQRPLGIEPEVCMVDISAGFGWMTPSVVGKLLDRVYPTTQASPELSAATAVAHVSFW